MDKLASTSWLAKQFDDPDLAVLDCMERTKETASGLQNRSGFHEYQRGHIPGAAFADLKGDLSDPDSRIGLQKRAADPTIPMTVAT